MPHFPPPPPPKKKKPKTKNLVTHKKKKYIKLKVYTKRESKIYPYDEQIKHHFKEAKINY